MLSLDNGVWLSIKRAAISDRLDHDEKFDWNSSNIVHLFLALIGIY
jgi:hypothetical protein